MSTEKKTRRPGAGRTKGAISLASINFQELKNILGEGYRGDIVISIKWFQSITEPSDFKVVRVDGGDIKTQAPVTGPVIKENESKPKFTIDEF